LNVFIFCFLALLFILTPYENGLYFDKDFYGIQIILYALFIMLFLTLLIKKELISMKRIWVVAILPFFYVISLWNAENPQGAWDSILRWTTYVAFFFLLYWSSKTNKTIHNLLPIIFQLTRIGIACHMFFNAMGFLSYHDAFINSRFAGVFQYPNTFGLVMAVFYLFSLLMLLNENQKILKVILYAAPLTLYMTNFIESFSRGMYIVFPIVWFVGMFLLKPSKQIRYVAYTGFTVIAALIASFGMDKVSSFINILILLSLSAATVCFVVFINRKALPQKIKMLDSKKVYAYLGPLIILVFAVLLLLDIGFKGLVYQQLPTDIQERVSSMSGSSTARERMIMMEDSFKMSADSPIFGFGGNAWETAYKKYQQLPYQANKIHNEYLEFVIDIGWLGLIAFMAIFGYLFYLIMQNYRKQENNMIYPAVLLSSLTIFLHSFIDFNLSFGTIWLIIFWLITLGIVVKPVIKKEIPKSTQNRDYYTIYLFGYFAILLISIVFSYRFMQAEQAIQEANNTKELNTRETLFEEAVSKNPYHSQYLYGLGNTYIQISDYVDKEEYMNDVEDISREMTELEPNNSMVLYQSGLLLEKIGKKEDAIKRYYDAIAVDSYDAKIYEAAIASSVDYALHLEESDPARMDYAEQAISLFETLKTDIAAFEENPIGQFHNSRDFQITNKTIDKIKKAYGILNRQME